MQKPKLDASQTKETSEKTAAAAMVSPDLPKESPAKRRTRASVQQVEEDAVVEEVWNIV